MIQTLVPILEQEQQIINELIFSDRFPWFYQSKQTVGKNPLEYEGVIDRPFFSHQLMARGYDPKSNGLINSNHYSFFEKIFCRWCDQEGIKLQFIYRAALNLVHHYKGKHTVPHVDHPEFPHKNWIWYLNNSTANTLIFDNNFDVSHTLPSKKNFASAFDGYEHAHEFPPEGTIRIVCVFTYLPKV